MLDMNHDLEVLHQEALRRRARQHLDYLDEMKAAQIANARGLSQREIAELLETSQARVHRLLKAAARHKEVEDVDPEEIILRTFAYDGDRSILVESLKKITYTVGEDAPFPFEGRIPGTWDLVVNSFAKGFLSEDEFLEIKNSVGR